MVRQAPLKSLLCESKNKGGKNSFQHSCSHFCVSGITRNNLSQFWMHLYLRSVHTWSTTRSPWCFLWETDPRPSDLNNTSFSNDTRSWIYYIKPAELEKANDSVFEQQVFISLMTSCCLCLGTRGLAWRVSELPAQLDCVWVLQ